MKRDYRIGNDQSHGCLYLYIIIADTCVPFAPIKHGDETRNSISTLDGQLVRNFGMHGRPTFLVNHHVIRLYNSSRNTPLNRLGRVGLKCQ